MILPDYDSPRDEIYAHVNLFENAPHDRVVIVLVPTTKSWEVPLLLRFGGFGDAPTPAEQSALFKRWFDQYGAEIVTLDSDTVEFTVADPPEEPAEAWELALEHYAVAPDLVWRGTESLPLLASSLEEAPTWVLWWAQDRR